MSQNGRHLRSIAITGLGVLSPVGIDTETYWKNLAAGVSGLSQPDEQLPGSQSVRKNLVAGEIKGFNARSARDYLPKNQRKNIKVMCRDILLGTSSAMIAVKDSGLDMKALDHDRIGVDFGANLMFTSPATLLDPAVGCAEGATFQVTNWGESGIPKMEPLWLLKYLPNMPACHIAIFVDSHGPSNTITQDEASGNLALNEAFRVMQRGVVDVMIAGSTGARLHDMKTLHAALWGELGFNEDDPTASCRPFDVDRNGQVVGEGSACFILEEEEHAQARGAKIYGYLLGGGSSCVSTGQKGHTREAVANAIRKALRTTGLSPADIGHINAHGIGEVDTDKAESQGILDVFGDTNPDIPVTSIKGHMGNAGAGAATLDLAASLLGLQHGLIPPTLHCDRPDPDCGLNIVHGEPAKANLPTVLNINFTRFGQASALIARANR